MWKRARLKRSTVRVHEHWRLRDSPKRLNGAQYAHGLGEKLDGAARALGLGRGILVQVARAHNLKNAPLEVDVAPLERRRLGGAHPRPEEGVNERMEVGMRPQSRPIGRQANMKPESLALEPAEDALPLVTGKGIRPGNLDARPGDALEGIAAEFVVD
ncbi:MAG TPA: hypothetical protein VMS22_23355 [Candidatus Eisenbacteria bacterium]|nr:hypothetical protein [Candidatus Eisenbacteria bacterium]